MLSLAIADDRKIRMLGTAGLYLADCLAAFVREWTGPAGAFQQRKNVLPFAGRLWMASETFLENIA